MNPRYVQSLNLARYGQLNPPLRVGPIGPLMLPKEPQKILRMLIQAPYSHGLQLPHQLFWLRNEIERSAAFQRENIGVSHPYTYITVRHGPVDSQNDDLWHVDGFSTRYTHLPEANYIFVLGNLATEWAAQTIKFPSDFDPLKHNVHLFLQKQVRQNAIRSLKIGEMYFIDPYVIHRRPKLGPVNRTFVRISFTPIEIPDINNTVNPLINTSHYSCDGVRFRESLLDYDLTQSPRVG